MTESTRTPATGEGAFPQRIAFIAQIDHTGIAGHRSNGLEGGLDLFSAADALGYDAGYVRSRHLQDTLSAPLPFLVAAGTRAPRMQLGTAMIPLWFENPARLAEELATTDLLLGGRLLPGLSSGYSSKVAPYLTAFGDDEIPAREQVDRTLQALLEHLDGDIVGTADTHFEDLEAGTPLRVRPQVTDLHERVAYGAASPARAARAGQQGLRLQLATLHPDDGSGRDLAQMQVETIRAYRDASRSYGHGEGFVSVSRQMIPVRDEAELEQYTTLLPHERSRVAGVDAEHHGGEVGGGDAVYARVVLDSADVVAEALRSDAAVREADEFVLVPPFIEGPVRAQQVLEAFAEQVVPLLRG